MRRARVLVLISGGGSNLQTLIDAARQPNCAYEIVHVIANRPDAFGLKRAEHAGIASACLDHKAFQVRADFDTALAALIDQITPDLIVLAGFMRIMGAEFVARYEGRMINIHPSLLPNFPGLHTHARALEAGVTLHGCTVHWVTAGVDEGAIIGQACVPVLPGDSPDDLAARVLVQEHRLYPVCVEAVASGRARLVNGRTYLDGKPGGIALMGI
ncbi:phosphoribosylglycinamide formyltransferase [Candidatus Phycosocius bacilliformis]|uniref:Phosphoribosylglycinamide formyltransferase n=1 Tax=Candidatus Phycosocius bacilliformis TaxID=1445552 RepID=A0A2P2E7R5_9PROT|nr:phosphoribosylglycinamide formyltransferase [Candidatus Phycosocius bacilliformis]GBF57112.1 phosphoribosylglycinamide formyltransferase [Candidatus Phycosocius bacilliformis]